MKPRIALVSMPWAPVAEPSLALGILKSQLTREGIDSRVFHSNLGLLRYLAGPAYQQVSACWGLNDFTFSALLDEKCSPQQIERLMERCVAQTEAEDGLPFETPGELGDALIEMRHRIVPQYLVECADEILAYEPTMVGFTCMFDQTIASAALALLIRQNAPETLIVFGGYALEGPPGLTVLNAFRHIDAIVVGDGEPVIAQLARASVDRARLFGIPGVWTRESPHVKPQGYALDDSPPPDYTDWYEDLSALRSRDRITVRTTVLPVESSRGCWWGQKQHCVFCGIDEQTLVYRTKKPDSVIAMLAGLRQRHGPETPFRFSDYILPHNFVTELLPRLAEVKPRYELHCEIKANQNEERVKAFADAGFKQLQPGVESFDSNVLRMMKKGVTGIQNVHLLKLGYLHGIQINYNILYGLPGERPEWYRRMVERIPRLYHLTPPVSRTETVVTRYAPLQTVPAQFGFDGVPQHHRCYDTLFSDEFLKQTGFSLDDYAYYFHRYFDYDVKALGFYSMLVHEVDHWKRQHVERDVMLSWEAVEGSVLIRDSRFGSFRELVLDPPSSRIFLACDRAPMTRDAMQEATGLSEDEITSGIDELEERMLVWTEDNRVLSLATPHEVVTGHLERGWLKSWTCLYC